MTRSEALAALIAKVEAGIAEGRVENDDFARAFPDDRSLNAFGAYLGYLDAAVAFVGAVLPGWGWLACDDSDGAMAIVGLTSCVSGDVVRAPTPARALLLAALRALAAQEGET